MAKATVNPPTYTIQLAEALRADMPSAEVDFERVRGDRYRFLVIWRRFNKLGHPERQARVWDVAERALAASDVLKVAMIITLGTDEAQNS
jgi:hypothetical protein